MDLARNPCISILMPIYKANKTIGPALLSTYLTMPARAELLLFLDGPGTNSKWLDVAARSRRIKIFRSDENIGIATSLNFLLEQSKSLYVGRMDADDIALPFRYGKALRRIRRGISDVVFTHSILFGAQVGLCVPIPQFPIPLNSEQAKLHLLIANPFVHPNMVAKKSVLLDSGGYKQCKAEDYELWLRLAASGVRLERLAVYGILYRRHGNQWTSDPNHEQLVKSDTEIVRGITMLRASLFGSFNLKGLSTHLIHKMLIESSPGLRLREKFLSGAIKKVRSRLG